jgi:hypothetical protein
LPIAKRYLPNAEVTALTNAAREAAETLRKSWDHWIIIGKAIDAYRRQLFRVLKINEPRGKEYQDLMGEYLIANEFHETCQHGFTKAERTNLQHCIDNLQAINKYRETLPFKTRQRLNNPSAMWLHWVKQTQGTPQKRVTVRATVASLQEENDKLQERVQQLEEALIVKDHTINTINRQSGFMWDQNPREVAEAMVKTSKDKAREMLIALRELLEE